MNICFNPPFLFRKGVFFNIYQFPIPRMGQKERLAPIEGVVPGIIGLSFSILESCKIIHTSVFAG